MTIFPGAGSIEIRVAVARGVVCSVEIRSTRPIGLTRVFLGREPNEAPALARQLFSLCGAAQAAAASQAVAWAQGRRLEQGEIFGYAIGVLAERVFEGLRGLALGWPGSENQDAVQARAAPHLREAATATRALLSASASGLGRARRQELLDFHARLLEAAYGLGVSHPLGAPAAASSHLARIARQCESETAFISSPVDALTQADDAAVIAALGRAPETFVGEPSLPNRRVETGPFARFGESAGVRAEGLAPRLNARLADIAEALSSLATSLRSGDVDLAAAPVGGAAGPGAGFGAVESARGRLYHLAQITSRGRVGEYRIVAPTEWNFHANGPFVAAVLGAGVARGGRAQTSLARLAALFDPCVGFEVALKEFADA